MARHFDIFTREDFENAVLVFRQYFDKREREKKPFQKIKLVSKRWRAPKTSAQHKCYWRCVSELKKAFIENGYDTNEDEVHEFVKRRSGFTKMLGDTMVTKSIADASDDATNENLKHLIDFMVRFAAENMQYQIEIGEDL